MNGLDLDNSLDRRGRLVGPKSHLVVQLARNVSLEASLDPNELPSSLVRSPAQTREQRNCWETSLARYAEDHPTILNQAE